MAITTYAELKTSVASWLARSDLTTQIPDFITLFEAEANRKLRVRQQRQTTTLTPTNGAVTLPSDYLYWKTVTVANYPPLEYKDPSWLYSAYTTSTEGTPLYFTIEGSTLTTRPAVADDIVLSYFEKIDALSDSNTTNWLLAAHPDVYLWGALHEAYSFTKAIDKAALAMGKRDSIFDSIIMLDQQSRGPSAISIIGTTP